MATKMLMEIKDDGFVLEMDDGSKYAINPYDASACCTWTLTNSMKIQQLKNQEFSYKITNITIDQSVLANLCAE